MNVIKIILLIFFVNIVFAQIRTANNYEETSTLIDQQEINANATVTLIQRDNLPRSGQNYSYKSNNLISRGYCADQPLTDQPSAGFCSGVLIAENVVLTAGHCIENKSDCDSTQFVFDFENQISNTPAGEIPIPPSILPESNVYGCTEVLFHNLNDDDDVAIIKLDRNVTGRTPVRWRRSGEINEQEDVYLISSPLGLPTKISEGSITYSDASTGLPIISDYAAIDGSSGAPVFNSESHLLESIHIGTALKNLTRNEFSPSGCRLWPDTNHKFDLITVTNQGQIQIPFGRSTSNPVRNYLDQLNRYRNSSYSNGGSESLYDVNDESRTGVQ